MRKKLAPGNNNTFLFGERLTSVNNVLAGISTYSMSLVPIPASEEKKPDKIRRQFLC